MAAEPSLGFPLRVALIGAGRVGTSVAALLRRGGHDVVAVWSRTPQTAELAARLLGAEVALSPAEAARTANVVLLGVVDHALEEIAQSVAPGLQNGAVVIHFAGAIGTEVLHAVEGVGATPVALHPVQSVPDVDVGIERLPGSAWGVTSSDAIREWARAFVTDKLGGLPVDVAEGDRPLWHAAAVMTSNGMAALLSMGAGLLAGIGVADPHAVLGPLAEGTIANVRTLGRGGAAFTGPVVRGDRVTVERHLSALTARFPELLEEYTLVARAIVSGAERTSRIDDDGARSMRALLGTA